jgi:type I restriction enzyme S subunit
MNSIQMSDTFKYVKVVSYTSLSNWSTSSILGNHLSYKAGLQLVKIGDLIKKNRKKINIEDELNYRRVTIRLYGKGVLQRDEVKGNEIGTKNQYVISTGQFIMSKIDARNGAFGIVPKELDGAIVTPDFLSYNVNEQIVNPRFFLLLTNTKQFNDLCQNSSSGTTGRQRIDESAFLNFKIPIPLIDAQKKLVSKHFGKIDLSNRQAQEATQLDEATNQHLVTQLGLTIQQSSYKKKHIHFVEFKNVSSWGIDKILNSSSFKSSKFSTITLESNPLLYKEILRGKSPKYDKNGKGLILNQKCNRWNSIAFEYAKTVNDKWLKGIDKEVFTKDGDIIINSTGEGTIGRATLITKKFEGLLYDSHIILLRVNSDKIDPLFLVTLLNHQYGQQQIESLKSAKSTKQTELGVQNLLKIFFPLPSLEKQNEIMQIVTVNTDKARDLVKLSQINQSIALEEFEKEIFA